MAYQSGNIVKFDVSFTDSSTGGAVDPSAVSVTYTINNGSTVGPIAYTSAATPSVGVVARLSAGNYEFWLDTTGINGVITLTWNATGSHQASVTDTISVGNSISSVNTFGDLIEKVYRRTMGGIRERAVQVIASGTPAAPSTSPITSGATSFVLTGSQTTSIMPGVLLAVDMEVMYVLNWTPYVSSGYTGVPYGTVTVQRGYNGSATAPHNANTLAYINPRYSRYDIGVAINDDLRSLSSPTNGLFRVGVAELTYNPVFAGYDLGALPANFIDVIEVRYRIAPPYRTFPPIRRWKVIRWNQGTTDAAFPSGNGLVLYEPGWPGLPIYVTYTAPFIKLVNTTDSIINTPAINDEAPPYNGYSTSVVPNMVPTMADLPPLGAEIDLTIPREISRNFMESQPDPSKAQEVMPGAVAGSVNALIARRAQRISEEADRLQRQYTRVSPL